LIPVDIVGIIREDLAKQKRDPDGLLHASSDLKGSLRHTQLNYVGAPKIERSMTEDIRTRTGWFWHDHVGKLLVDAGVPVMREINLTPWMPAGWTGTADWLFWSPKYQAFVLGDLKTTKGEAIKYREKEGMSADHWWQLSAYWYACVQMGLPMVKGFGVMYLPMNTKLGEEIEPVMMEADPIPEADIRLRMTEVTAKCKNYATVVEREGRFLNEYLAPPMDRVQKLFWSRANGVWELKLVPHWLHDFCPFDNSLCDCSEQGTTKVGEYRVAEKPYEGGEPTAVEYWPRKGYEDVEPVEAPDAREVKRRMR
jgi:hypothetical protein